MGQAGRRGSAVHRDRLSYSELTVKDEVVENSWVRTSTKTNETNIGRVYQRSLCQQGNNNVLLEKELREITTLVIPVLMGNFHFTDISSDNHTVGTERVKENPETL